MTVLGKLTPCTSFQIMPEETVYTITDWYDGPRGGVASFEGQPHYYESRWDNELDDWSTYYLLTPLDATTFQLALEDWAIWERWEAAFKKGETTNDTHPALPEDQVRHKEIDQLLTGKLVVSPLSSFRARATFHYVGSKSFVEWSVIR